MTKFHGPIGFGEDVERSPGVFEQAIVERSYSGEVIREVLDRVAGQTVLGESKTGNSFRIVADAYATLNFFDMMYVKWNSKYWAITQVEVLQRPRLLVRIGGVWNGEIATPSPSATP